MWKMCVTIFKMSSFVILLDKLFLRNFWNGFLIILLYISNYPECNNMSCLKRTYYKKNLGFILIIYISFIFLDIIYKANIMFCDE